MKRIAIIICWFGPLPDMFPLWCKSCAANPSVDWLLFTDQDPAQVPDNVHVHRTAFAELGVLARRKLDFPDLSLETPYKLCDYKVMYGVIFEDWLKEYDFWGYCDLDMVFGDLRGFFTDEMLDRYDKLLSCGHLSLYRNTPEVNARYLLSGGKFSAEEVMRSPWNFAFDEWRGIFRIYRQNNFPMYEEVPYADISWTHKRFSLHRRSSSKYCTPAPDYKRQVFYYEGGRIFRAYLDGNGEVCSDQFLYIHLMKRKFPPVGEDVLNSSAFYCTPYGFLPKEPGRLPGKKGIGKLNPYRGLLYETIERKIRTWLLKRYNHKVFVRRRGKTGEKKK